MGTNDVILAQNKLLTQRMKELTKHMAALPQQLKGMQESTSKQKVMKCDTCEIDHPTGYCLQEEEAKYMGNQTRQGQFQNFNYSRGNNQNYNQGWKQDVGPSARQTPFQQFNQQPPTQDRTSKLNDTLMQFMQMSMSNQKNTDASIKNLETQIGQLAKQLADQPGGTFSANTQTNPKEHCKAITTRSGITISKGIGDNLIVE